MDREKHRTKYKLAGLLIAICMGNLVHAAESDFYMTMSLESIEHGSAASLSATAGSEVFYGGISLNRIESSRVIQRFNRKIIYPVYLFMGLQVPGPVSPYIEGAIDLPEAIIDDLLDNDENSKAQADYYYSVGVRFRYSNKISYAIYAKKYYFIFREGVNEPTMEKRPESYGVGLSLAF